MDPNQLPSLQGMKDIVLPPPVPLTPATPAWVALFALLALLLAWAGLRMLRRWHRDAYRREARRAARAALARDDVASLPALVKRTALAAFPRRRVATLSGRDWAVFLRSTAPRAHISIEAAEALARWPYLTAEDQRRTASLAGAAARDWIARHDRRL